jgi:hypothetical protein
VRMSTNNSVQRERPKWTVGKSIEIFSISNRRQISTIADSRRETSSGTYGQVPR